MNTFAPLFSSIVDSSLWDEPPHIRVLFVTMLVLKDSDNVVRANEYRLHKRANIPLKQVMEGIRKLTEPDQRRPGQKFEGRRIKAVEDGWLILNGELYQKEMRKISERVRKARWARENRVKGKPAFSAPMSPGSKEEQSTIRNGDH